VRSALAVAAAVAALAAATPASAVRISVGLAPDAPREAVLAAVAEAGGTLAEDLGPLDALVFDVPDAAAGMTAVRGLPAVEYAERVKVTRRLAFTPNDPLFDRQWYLASIRAFDHWAENPAHPPVLVAVVDSGIDGRHPEFAGRIAGARSFVASPALVDRAGHGTVVAGQIAAAVDNERGIAGAGPSVELLVAKVVRPDGGISVLAEARAIRWAVDRGAKVINLSLGGRRDPRNPARDTYSRLEHAAIDYATRRGVLVVAAVGNCGALRCPERYASWPAALPHVVGVSALSRELRVPTFSNRDLVHNDVAAPGVGILSTYPRRLTPRRCPYRGYTLCAQYRYERSPRGTSFSAPLVSAAGAVLLGERGLLGLEPLHSSQLSAALTRSAVDVGVAGRDPASGNGRLDTAAALESLSEPLPPRDRREANDDAGTRARTLAGTVGTVEATLDRWDDVRDVYRIRLVAGRTVVLTLDGPSGGNSNLFLWRPGTEHVTGRGVRRADRLAASAQPGSFERIAFRPRRTGWHYVEARLASGASGEYRLTIERR
jgi:subtilisin family serine protease